VDGNLGAIPLAVGALGTLVAYGVIIIAVWKIFSISSEMAVLKQMLRDIQHNTEDHSFAALASEPQSPENLARALNAAAYREADPAIAIEHEPSK
jgi:hypothetical protein